VASELGSHLRVWPMASTRTYKRTSIQRCSVISSARTAVGRSRLLSQRSGIYCRMVSGIRHWVSTASAKGGTFSDHCLFS